MPASKMDPKFVAGLADVQSEETTSDRLVSSRNVADNPLSTHLAATYDDPTKIEYRTIPARNIKDDDGNVIGREEARKMWVGTPRQIRATAATAKPIHDLLRRAAAALRVGSTINFLDKDGAVIARPALPGFKGEDGVKVMAGNTIVFVVFAAKEKTVRARTDNDVAENDDDDDDGLDEFDEATE